MRRQGRPSRASRRSGRRQNDWNEYVITARGDHVTIELNGTKVIERTDPRFDKTGIIALQVHQGQVTEVRFKDVEIKELNF